MQDQTIRVAIDTALEKRVIWSSSASENQRLVPFFAAAQQQQRIFVVKLLRDFIEKIIGQAVDMNELLFGGENELFDRLFFLDEFSGPLERHFAVDVLRLFFARPPFALG